MNIQELRAAIHGLVNQTDDPKVLQGVYLLLKRWLATVDGIVGYDADGTPVTADGLVRSVFEADRDIEAGHGISHSAMKAKYGVAKDMK